MKNLLTTVVLMFALTSGASAYDADIAQAQSNLHILGYDPGPFDGKMGPSTKTAISQFQTDNGLPQNSQLDMPTLKAINRRLTDKMLRDMERYKAGQAGQ